MRPSPAPRSSAGPPPGCVLNWEEEKSRILAAWESESDGGQQDFAERMKVTEVVQTTDRIVADLERQLTQMQHLLASQSGSPAPPVMGAAALGELIDLDAVVREERQALRRLQDEWREKLRQAEIDISQERRRSPANGPNWRKNATPWKPKPTGPPPNPIDRQAGRRPLAGPAGATEKDEG